MSLLPATGAKDTPKTYDREKVISFLDGLAVGLNLEDAARSAGLAMGTIVKWVYQDTPAGLREAYITAKAMGVEVHVSQMLAIADDETRDQVTSQTETGGLTVSNTNAPARDRLRIDTRKWYVSKIAPKLYGDKIEVEHTGTGDGRVTINVVSNIPGPPGELLGEDIPDAEYEEVNPADDIEDLL